MNIRKDEAGYVTRDHIIKRGFTVYDTIEGNDMGQIPYSMPQYTNGRLKITGGYWTYWIKNENNETVWEGWWNSNDEFDETIKSLM